MASWVRPVVWKGKVYIEPTYTESKYGESLGPGVYLLKNEASKASIVYFDSVSSRRLSEWVDQYGCVFELLGALVPRRFMSTWNEG